MSEDYDNIQLQRIVSKLEIINTLLDILQKKKDALSFELKNLDSIVSQNQKKGIESE
jgi:hypothetical protein